MKFVPVDPPQRRPSTWFRWRIAASDAMSGAFSMPSMTPGVNDRSTRGLPMPSINDPDASRSERSPVA